MADDILDEPATPERVGRLVTAGVLPGDDAARAYDAASATPSRAGWARIVDRTLLVLGALLAVAGVIFFFAFNGAPSGESVLVGLRDVERVPLTPESTPGGGPPRVR